VKRVVSNHQSIVLNWKLRFVLFALMLWLAPRAVAQQPFTTDDADVTARGKFHFEFSNSYDLLQRSALPAVRQNTVSFEIGYGLLEGVEIGVEMPLITIFNAGTRRRDASQE
jgi:hypothetical protein